MMTITKPGLLTTVQDLGRLGYQKYGVIASGVMDPLSHRIANLLVGNEENFPTLEITLIGPTIHFHKDTLISICGGDLSPTIDGKSVLTWRTVLVKKDSILKFGSCKSGCRVYLAVSGGFSVPTILNSKSTYLRAKIGGFRGRALQTGDVLSYGSPSDDSMKLFHALKKRLDGPFIENGWSVSSEMIWILKKDAMVRVMKGRQFHLFKRESQEKFFEDTYEVMVESDRMGYRLEGPSLALKVAEEMVSEAVNFGTIQVPSNGKPIILLADRQTTGGYPKIGQVATVDFPILAQTKPFDRLYFKEISHEEAQQLLLEREQKIGQLKQGIKLKLQ